MDFLLDDGMDAIERDNPSLHSPPHFVRSCAEPVSATQYFTPRVMPHLARGSLLAEFAEAGHTVCPASCGWWWGRRCPLLAYQCFLHLLVDPDVFGEVAHVIVSDGRFAVVVPDPGPPEAVAVASW